MLEATHQCIGKYTLRECLGRGGISEVWKAFDSGLDRYVAVKLLQASRQTHPDFVERFQREARVIAALHHPNIVQVYDIGSFDVPDANDVVASYMVMRYVQGETLADYIEKTSRTGRFPKTANIVELFAGIGSALDYAHRRGVIHCDVKPSNILLDKHNSFASLGEPILTDFGLAFQQETEVPLADEPDTVIGTPYYIAPEQAQGYAATAASDLYSLGVVLYELCTGRLPFEFPDQPSGRHPVAVVLQQVMFDPIPPSFANPRISPDLEAVILKSIARDPQDRFPNGATFVEALARALAVPLAQHVDLSHLAVSTPVNLPQQSMGRNTSGSHHVAAMPVLRKPESSASPSKQRSVSERAHIIRSWKPIALSNLRVRPRHPKFVIVLSALLLFFVVAMAVAVFRVGGMRTQVHPMTDAINLGQISFLNSGHGTASSLGINDEIQVDLAHLTAPDPGKQYYAWLLSDSNRSDSPVVLLGALNVSHGSAHLTYIDQQHSNLLATMSRFLVTEEDAGVMPAIPSPDKTTWLGVGAISQIPSKIDVDHFSLLDHLRHLLAADPTLDALGLHGGLSYWLFKNEGLVQGYAQGARDSYDTKDTVHLHRELVRLLDYLDGTSNVANDVPPETPVLVDPTSAQVGLLQVRAYQNPPSYMYHIGLHLSGMVSSPGATPTQVRIAQSIVSDMSVVRQLLEQMRAIATRIVALPSDQLMQPDVKSQLITLAHLATIAFTGQDNMLHGVTWIHEQLATLAVVPVTAYQME